jgi:hypothetical protein
MTVAQLIAEIEAQCDDVGLEIVADVMRLRAAAAYERRMGRERLMGWERRATESDRKAVEALAKLGA